MLNSRGQALVETAILLPIVLFVLFAIIYVANMGVVDERAQLSLRYGGIASFAATQTGPYSVGSIYNNLNPTLAAAPCPTPPASTFTSTSPFPGPTSAPFWQPVSVAPTCAPSIVSIGGAQFLASHFVAATNPQVTTVVNVPLILKMGSTFKRTASGVFVHAASPGVILFCSQEVLTRVTAAITASGSAPAPTPIPIGSTPSPAPPGNGQKGNC